MALRPQGPESSTAPGQTSLNVFQNYAVENKSPFDINRLADKFRYRNTGWTIPEAILALLFASAMADGSFNNEESQQIQAIARRSRALRSLSPQDLANANTTVNQRMQENPNALKEACATLPADMCLPFFAHCVDIILSDGELTKAEAEFLNELGPMLDIDPDHARRVMEVLLLKAQY